MPLNTSIIGGLQSAQIEGPANRLARVMQLQGAEQANQLNALQMRKYQSDMEAADLERQDQNALRQLMGQQGFDLSKPEWQQKAYAASPKAGGAVIKQFQEGQKGNSDMLAKDTESENRVVSTYRDFIGNATTPELAAEYIKAMHTDPRLKNTAMARVPVESVLSQIGNDPAGFEEFKKRFALGAASFIEKNKPTYQQINSNNEVKLLALPGLGGAPTTVSQATIKESEPQRLAREQQAAEAAKARAVTIRGQDLTNARAIEANTIKQGEKKATEDLTKGSQIASFETMLGTLDRLGAHPGLAKSVGLRSVLPTIPGGDSANFQAELNSFQSQAFIPMVSQLKGMGALSDAEGKKLTQAVGALNLEMGEEAFRASVDRIKSDMEAAYARVAGKPRKGVAAGSGSTGAKTVNFEDLK